MGEVKAMGVAYLPIPYKTTKITMPDSNRCSGMV